ncbi:unnamed protein product [Amoebophrya sp. A25]|nr:unnamed protein product [Amoebophrya sp. A25]|eukprot:GSA25T00022282001.1
MLDGVTTQNDADRSTTGGGGSTMMDSCRAVKIRNAASTSRPFAHRETREEIRVETACIAQEGSQHHCSTSRTTSSHVGANYVEQAADARTSARTNHVLQEQGKQATTTPHDINLLSRTLSSSSSRPPRLPQKKPSASSSKQALRISSSALDASSLMQKLSALSSLQEEEEVRTLSAQPEGEQVDHQKSCHQKSSCVSLSNPEQELQAPHAPCLQELRLPCRQQGPRTTSSSSTTPIIIASASSPSIAGAPAPATTGSTSSRPREIHLTRTTRALTTVGEFIDLSGSSKAPTLEVEEEEVGQVRGDCLPFSPLPKSGQGSSSGSGRGRGGAICRRHVDANDVGEVDHAIVHVASARRGPRGPGIVARTMGEAPEGCVIQHLTTRGEEETAHVGKSSGEEPRGEHLQARHEELLERLCSPPTLHLQEKIQQDGVKSMSKNIAEGKTSIAEGRLSDRSSSSGSVTQDPGIGVHDHKVTGSSPC